MKSKFARILITIAAMIIGIGIVYALTLLSGQSKGPIEQVLSNVETTVRDFEEKAIINQQTEKRSDKLKWLQQYINNPQKLKNPKPVFFGAFDNNAVRNFKPIINLEDTLKTTFPLIHIYTAWGSKSEQKFPASQVEDIKGMGSIPVITWEPWLSAFDDKIHTELKPLQTRDKEGLTDITNGTYDFYIKKWAAQAKKVKTPIFLRLAHEMNDPYRYPWGPQNNASKDFVTAWQHIHNLFKKEGATNVIWIWSPHPAYGLFQEYYPGDEYVDYVGIGTLNYGPVVNWAKWWTFDEIFGNYYKDLSAFNKPIMLNEFASLSFGGSRSKWYSDALKNIPVKYPLVKSILYFHFDADNTTTQQVLDWTIVHDKEIINTIIKRINGWNDSLKVK